MQTTGFSLSILGMRPAPDLSTQLAVMWHVTTVDTIFIVARVRSSWILRTFAQEH